MKKVDINVHYDYGMYIPYTDSQPIDQCPESTDTSTAHTIASREACSARPRGLRDRPSPA